MIALFLYAVLIVLFIQQTFAAASGSLPPPKEGGIQCRIRFDGKDSFHDCGSDFGYCASYKTPCEQGLANCNAEQIANKTPVEQYSCAEAEGCASLDGDSTHYQDVVCCNTDRCNANGFSTLPPPKTGGIRCRLRFEKQDSFAECNTDFGYCATYKTPCEDGLANCDAADVAAKTVVQQYGCADQATCESIVGQGSQHIQDATCCNTDACNADGLEDSSSGTTPTQTTALPAPKQGGIRCQVRIDNVDSIIACGEDFGYCATYKTPCEQGLANCNEEQIAAQTLVQQYSCAEKASCEAFATDSLHYREVSCCNTDECNVDIVDKQPNNSSNVSQSIALLIVVLFVVFISL